MVKYTEKQGTSILPGFDIGFSPLQPPTLATFNLNSQIISSSHIQPFELSKSPPNLHRPYIRATVLANKFLPTTIETYEPISYTWSQFRGCYEESWEFWHDGLLNVKEICKSWNGARESVRPKATRRLIPDRDSLRPSFSHSSHPISGEDINYCRISTFEPRFSR